MYIHPHFNTQHAVGVAACEHLLEVNMQRALGHFNNALAPIYNKR